jgi:hypothetical protein
VSYIAMIVAFALSISEGLCQSSFEKIKFVAIGGKIDAAFVDRVGELYVQTEENFMYKISVHGESLAQAKLSSKPTLFDPRDGSHLFLYWKDQQNYELRLPDLSVISKQDLDSSFAVNPYLVCPSGDHDLLILDSADWSLKKVSTRTNLVLYETIIFDNPPQPFHITLMREYQNFIFLLDRNQGIFIFNRMGKMLKNLPGKNLPYFNFLGEELYYPEKGGLHFFDLFTAEERSLKLPPYSKAALLTDERLFLVNDHGVDILSVVP